MSISLFHRSFNRATVSGPGFVECVCRARAGYRLTSGSRTLYRCPACASHYDNREWQHEALPHIARAHEALLVEGYTLHRQHGFTPDQIARTFRETFKGRIEQLEARYQADLAGGKVRAS